MSAVIGIVGAFIIIMVGMSLKGGSIGGIISIPAFVMVIGGTLGVLIASAGMSAVGKMISLSLGRSLRARCM